MIEPQLAVGWPRGTVLSVIDGLTTPQPLAIDMQEWMSIHRAIENRFREIRPWFDADLQEILIRAVSPILPLAKDVLEVDRVLEDCTTFLSGHGSIGAVVDAARRYGGYQDRLQAERDRMPGYVTRRAFEIVDEMNRKCRDCSMSTALGEGRMSLTLRLPFVVISHFVGLDPAPIRYMVPIDSEPRGRSRETTPPEPLLA